MKDSKYYDEAEIMAMAEKHKVSDNPLFLQTLKNYQTIQLSIGTVDKLLRENPEVTISKEYVKGRENLYMHPAVKELPKQIEASNKTIATLLSIIEKMGTIEDYEHSEIYEFINKRPY